MSTRAVATVLENNQPVATIYKHWDGGPEWFGKKLKQIAGRYIVVNGFSSDMKADEVTNGMGDFAAMLVKELKEGIGDVYLSAPNPDMWQEYEYTLKQVGDKIKVVTRKA